MLRILQGHSDIVRSVSFSPDGTRLLSASQDRTVKLWDFTTGQELLSLSEEDGFSHDASFSPDGKRLMTVSSDGRIRIWDSRPIVHTAEP
jgi:WD40 repeat protein